MEHRRALFRNMVTSLIVEERIETTLAKAKELRRVADRMVTLGKRGTLHARRQALGYVQSKPAVQKLFAEIAVRFVERNGGYTRIIKLGQRRGDGADMAIIEYLGAPMKPSREERRKAGEAERAKKQAAKKGSTRKKKAAGKKKAAAAKSEKAPTAKKTEKAAAKSEPKASKKAAAEKTAKKTETKKTEKTPQKKGMIGRVLGRKSKAKK